MKRIKAGLLLSLILLTLFSANVIVFAEPTSSSTESSSDQAMNGESLLTEEAQSGESMLTDEAQSDEPMLTEEAQSGESMLTDEAQSGDSMLTDDALSGGSGANAAAPEKVTILEFKNLDKDDELELDWEEAYDVAGIAKYEVYSGNTLVGSTKDTMYDFKGTLSDYEDNNYTVKAINTDGLTSLSDPVKYLKPISPYLIVGLIIGAIALYILLQLFLPSKIASSVRVVMSYIILLSLLIITIFPVIWIIITSIKIENSITNSSIHYFWPIDDNGNWQVTLKHYKELFVGDRQIYVTWFWNTVKVATLSMIFGTILTILSSYALSRFRFTGRQTSLTVLLILGMFPGFMAMIAIYIFLQELELIDTHLALILVYSLGAPLGGVFVAKGFYDTIPKSLEEAARIDGASQLGIFFRIVLPLSKPMLTFIALTIFTGTWVDFIFAKIILFKPENWTLGVGLLSFIDKGKNEYFYNSFAAGSILAAIPIVILFIFLQRFLVEGLTAGASKG